MSDSLIDLEIKISHQEVEIEDLKKIVYEQTKTIERLEKDLKRITDRLDSVVNPQQIGPGNEKPPHY